MRFSCSATTSEFITSYYKNYFCKTYQFVWQRIPTDMHCNGELYLYKIYLLYITVPYKTTSLLQGISLIYQDTATYSPLQPYKIYSFSRRTASFAVNSLAKERYGSTSIFFAPTGQRRRQRKQERHLEASIVWQSSAIACVGHSATHRPHCVHLSDVNG